MKTLPFRTDFYEPMLSGRKTTTARTQQYGTAGETFPAFGRTFMIDWVRPMTVKDVAEKYFYAEGFDDREAFLKVWWEIHPYNRDLDRRVWLHKFHLVTGDGGDPTKVTFQQ
jgi:hypothetical protein